jgi:hypothetical protein
MWSSRKFIKVSTIIQQLGKVRIFLYHKLFCLSSSKIPQKLKTTIIFLRNALQFTDFLNTRRNQQNIKIYDRTPKLEFTSNSKAIYVYIKLYIYIIYIYTCSRFYINMYIQYMHMCIYTHICVPYSY